jgi:predicted acetyltransferase
MPLSLNHQALLDRVKDRSNYKLKFIIDEKDGSQSSLQTYEDVDVEIKCSINSYSSWITGMISLKELYETGQLETTKHQLLKQIDLEMAFDSPESYTRF